MKQRSIFAQRKLQSIFAKRKLTMTRNSEAFSRSESCEAFSRSESCVAFSRSESLKRLLWLCILTTVLAAAGCKKAPKTEEAPPDYQHITWQTDAVNSVRPRGMDDGAFYVEHTNEDGTKVYYSLGTPASGEDSLYYLAGHEDTPTLFLGQGDRLVYHSNTLLLRDIFLTRLEDLGYTIGIYNISSMENGRCYLSTESDHVLPLCTDAGFLEEQEAENILIDEMGLLLPSGYEFGTPEEGKRTCVLEDGILSFYDGLTLTVARTAEDYDMSGMSETEPSLADLRYPKLTSEILQKGILYGLEKNETYHLEYYSGTYYATSNMTANIHIYSPKEYFHTNQYNVLQSTLFEIVLPELENGIYAVGTISGAERAVFRLIREAEYSIDDVFDTYRFPEGIYGISSETASQNRLYVQSGMKNAAGLSGEALAVSEDNIVTLADETGCYFFYETDTYEEDEEKDNGISWYYRKDGIELGRILHRHKDFFQSFAAFPEMEPQEEGTETLITVVELPENRYIVRFYGYENIPYEVPVLGETVVQSCLEADILFTHGSGLFLMPMPETSGVVVLNAKPAQETEQRFVPETETETETETEEDQ